ncbi:MAG: arsenate reductase (glutaredoxin) [Flavobacteriaceae bacterium]|nr:arsenate reductase (glutaredoxin) [Flavobacteriaceae bacterium]
MIKIYHNNRCRKSREGLAILEKSGQEFEIINYLENPPSKSELEDILHRLGISPIQLVRKNEKIWKENFKHKDLTDDQIIEIMIQNPKLIERPIVIKDDRVVLGRPPEDILNIL